mmetsp:Transcript_34346/g.55556  ORF Transcript_34346/g.55556 Transcript_34346/m.55556 type:complete len:212 (-) Transcript_34346:9-644(-)
MRPSLAQSDAWTTAGLEKMGFLRPVRNIQIMPPTPTPSPPPPARDSSPSADADADDRNAYTVPAKVQTISSLEGRCKAGDEKIGASSCMRWTQHFRFRSSPYTWLSWQPHHTIPLSPSTTGVLFTCPLVSNCHSTDPVLALSVKMDFPYVPTTTDVPSQLKAAEPSIRPLSVVIQYIRPVSKSMAANRCACDPIYTVLVFLLLLHPLLWSC